MVLVVEYPPLYPKVQSGNPYPVKMWINKLSASGGLYFISLDAYRTDSNIISVNSPDGEDILLYYAKKLRSGGWEDYKLDAATGPSGASLEWTKNGHYFQVGYSAKLKNGSVIGYQLSVVYN
jgi:hypothetical protein